MLDGSFGVFVPCCQPNILYPKATHLLASFGRDKPVLTSSQVWSSLKFSKGFSQPVPCRRGKQRCCCCQRFLRRCRSGWCGVSDRAGMSKAAFCCACTHTVGQEHQLLHDANVPFKLAKCICVFSGHWALRRCQCTHVSTSHYYLLHVCIF